jgi:hypothetical protein
MEPIRIVLRYLDGRIVKGYTQDFNPGRPSFHLHKDPAGSSSDQPVQLEMKELKAVFFVKTFEGNRSYNERKEFGEGDRPQGRKVEVTFVDGEQMQGSTVGYDPERPGFFLFPADPGGNNIRIFVVSAAVKDFRYL